MNLGRTGGACHCDQCDDVSKPSVCIDCNCEGGDGYSEMPYKCARCEMKDHLTENGCKPQNDSGLANCPLCGGAAIVWIDPKLSTLTPPTDFYSIGCINFESCGVEVNGWLNKADMIKHWNKRAK